MKYGLYFFLLFAALRFCTAQRPQQNKYSNIFIHEIEAKNDNDNDNDNTIIRPQQHQNDNKTIIYADSFEDGWGQFHSGHHHHYANRVDDAKQASDGNYCLQIQYQKNNHNNNNRLFGRRQKLYSNAFDVVPYSEITITFSFLTRRFLHDDSFVVETSNSSNNNNNFWNFWNNNIWKEETVYKMGDDFVMDSTHYEKHITINTTATKSIAIAFVNKASFNKGEIYIDDVTITGK